MRTRSPSTESEDTHLRAAEQLLDDDVRSRRTESLRFETFAERELGSVHAVADKHPFAERETVGLDHARSAVIGDERTEARTVLDASGNPSCRRDAGVTHDLFGKCFRRLDARGSCGGTEHRDAACRARVGDTGSGSGVRSDDDEIDSALRGEPCDGSRVLDVERDVLGDTCSPPVARRDDDLEVGVVALAHPGQRVFTASAADDENSRYSHSMVDGGLLEMS